MKRLTNGLKLNNEQYVQLSILVLIVTGMILSATLL